MTTDIYTLVDNPGSAKVVQASPEHLIAYRANYYCNSQWFPFILMQALVIVSTFYFG